MDRLIADYLYSPAQPLALLSLPVAALGLDDDTVERLNKPGLRQVKDFIGMPKSAFRCRFNGKQFKIHNS